MDLSETHTGKLYSATVRLTGKLTDGSGPYHITMEGTAPYYTPVVATVPAGYSIQWDNRTGTVHTVTHDACLTEKACAFDSGSVASGKSFTLSFLPPGKYPYFCRLHPIMRGTLIVERNKIATGPNHKLSANIT